jgi:hypothetical protein
MLWNENRESLSIALSVRVVHGERERDRVGGGSGGGVKWPTDLTKKKIIVFFTRFLFFFFFLSNKGVLLSLVII